VTVVYRVALARRAKEAFSGEGARLYGGRWNPPGFSVVYASQSRALAVLETFVHLTLEARDQRFVIFEVKLPARARTERYHAPAVAWRRWKPTAASQDAGRAWLTASRALAFVVPSVLIPQEMNYVLNVRHAQFSRLRISAPEPFSFDGRLWK
jgi:RES domain-containing protein